MVDLANAQPSEVGETSPTDASKKAVQNIVDDALEHAGVKSEDEVAPDLAKESPAKEPKEPKEPKADPEEKVEETEEEPEAEAKDEAEAEQTDEDKDDEDLIPRSKIQPRMDKLTAQIKKLEAENNQLKSKAPQTQEEKLDRLSIDDLKNLKRQTRLAERQEDDPKRLEELMDLEDSIDSKISNFPNRFAQTQVKNLSAVLPDFAKIDPEVVNQKGPLWNTAANIYSRVSSLRTSEMGQVEAMLLAAEHLSMAQKSSDSKATGSTLQRQVTNLKSKTALAGKTRVVQDKSTSVAKLLEKARSSRDMNDKQDFFKALVPDDFLQQ